MLIFFWKTGVPGGNIGTGVASGASAVFGVGVSTGGVAVSGIRLRILIEIGIGNNGTSLRRTLINQEEVVATWTHSEQTSEYGSRDISGQGNHGIYEGVGFVHGVTVDDLPEGGIATHFNGNNLVRIPNDGLTGGRNLSFAGGDFDIFIYFRTVINDANPRGVITKFSTGPNNGWYIQIQGGQLKGGLFVGGSEIFGLQSGFVSNGLWHRAHLCMTGGQARWTLDGVQGSPVSAGTEPTPSSADVIVAGWDGEDIASRRFVGDLHYILLSREGKTTLGQEAEACIPWTDISNDLTGLEITVGDQSGTILGSTAPTGKATFKLNNFTPLGRYSPGHANALTGFGLANPVRIRTTDGTTIRPLFRGFISGIFPDTGINQERKVSVDCVDWMEVLAVSPVGPISVVLNKSSDHCIKRLLDVVNRPPVAVEFDLGNESFPYAFDQVDGISGKVLQEVHEVNYNEGGCVYIKRDGTFRGESRQRRQLPASPVAILFGDWQDLNAGMDLQDVINRQQATVYPREAGEDVNTIVAGTVSAGSTPRRTRLIPGTVVPISGSYSDPEERSTSVGATDIQPLVAGLDYTMTENEDGSGTNLTSSVEFISGNPPQSGSSYSVEVINNSSVDGWFQMQVRGRILRRFDPQTTVFKDDDSENQFFPREPPTMNLRYISDIDAGFSRCKFMVNVFKTPTMRPRTMTTMLDPKSTIMTNFLDFELGKMVTISESMSGINAVGYWIAAMSYSFRENNICTMTVSLVPSVNTGPVFIIGDAELGVIGTAVVGY